MTFDQYPFGQTLMKRLYISKIDSEILSSDYLSRHPYQCYSAGELGCWTPFKIASRIDTQQEVQDHTIGWLFRSNLHQCHILCMPHRSIKGPTAVVNKLMVVQIANLPQDSQLRQLTTCVSGPSMVSWWHPQLTAKFLWAQARLSALVIQLWRLAKSLLWFLWVVQAVVQLTTCKHSSHNKPVWGQSAVKFQRITKVAQRLQIHLSTRQRHLAACQWTCS